MGFGHTTSENFKYAVAGTPGTWAAAAVYGSWVQLAGVARRAQLIAVNGELDANMTVAVYEATDASGTGAQALTGLTGTFHNGADEGLLGLIEVRDDDLSDGYDYIAVLCTPGATDTFAAVWQLGELYSYPADNSTAAFDTGE